jgi:competence protein ComEA
MKTFKKHLIFILAIFILAGFCQQTIAESGKININTASKAQLMTIKGIGSKIADRIIEYREAHQFKSIEEITEIKGIGEKFLEKNKDLITVE